MSSIYASIYASNYVNNSAGICKRFAYGVLRPPPIRDYPDSNGAMRAGGTPARTERTRCRARLLRYGFVPMRLFRRNTVFKRARSSIFRRRVVGDGALLTTIRAYFTGFAVQCFLEKAGHTVFFVPPRHTGGAGGVYGHKARNRTDRAAQSGHKPAERCILHMGAAASHAGKHADAAVCLRRRQAAHAAGDQPGLADPQDHGQHADERSGDERVRCTLR